MAAVLGGVEVVAVASTAGVRERLTVPCLVIEVPAFNLVATVADCHLLETSLNVARSVRLRYRLPRYCSTIPFECRRKHYVFGLPVRRIRPSVRSFTRSSGRILLPRYLTNGLSNCEKTNVNYSVAPTDDLLDFRDQRSRSQQVVEVVRHPRRR